MPLRHHEVVTARVVAPRDQLLDARASLAAVLAKLDADFPATPDGLGRHRRLGPAVLPTPRAGRLPTCTSRSTAGPASDALFDAIRFPSDPDDTLLEENDVAFLFRSDNEEHIRAAATEIADRMKGALAVTSIRKGFAGQMDGGKGLPKEMAMAAGVPGADLIPDGSELFLGFTSTQRNALGPRRIVNFETLGLVDLGPRSYFHGGTHMHLSHIFEDLEAWYLNFDFRERVDTTFRPRLPVRAGNADGSAAAAPRRVGERGASRLRPFRSDRPQLVAPAGLAPAARHPGLGRDALPKGTAIPQRADFNTLDNPFFWSVGPEARPDGRRAGRGPPLRRLQPDERRLPPQPARDGRRACPAARSCRSRRGRPARASTRSCRRRTGRTSSSRRGATARSRSSN